MISNIILGFAFYAASEEGGGGLLSVNGGLAFWTVITFIALLLILRKFAWKPILSFLSEREKQIEDSLRSADIANQEAKKLTEENKQIIQRAEEEAKKIREQIRTDAQNAREKLLQESKEQAQKIIEDAIKESERKSAEIFGELKNQIASISIEIAEKLIKQNVDAETNKGVVEDYLKDILKN